jgi:hypothetical protein
VYATVNGHVSIGEINRRGLPEEAQRHLGGTQPSGDKPMHGAAQGTAMAAARLVVMEVCCPRFTGKLLRQQPQKCHDIGLLYHLGSLRPLPPPQHHVHWDGTTGVIRQIDLLESKIACELLEQSRFGIKAGRYRLCGTAPLLQLRVVQAEATLLSNTFVWIGIAFCISQSAIFSVLNLAIFSISKSRLEIEAAGGNNDAVGLLALRKDSNLTLATVLWGNVTINVLLTLLSPD